MARTGGRVIALHDGEAEIAVLAESSAGCGSCGGCGGTCNAARVRIRVAAPDGLKVGDDVTVEIPGPGPGRTAALLLLVPAVLFIAGVLTMSTLQARGAAPGGDGISALAGLILMALWYVGVGRYDRRLRRSPEYRPRLVSWPGQPNGSDAGRQGSGTEGTEGTAGA